MTFRINDQHLDEYTRLGFTVFRRLMSPALIKDFRIEAEKARKIAHKLEGTQTQRLEGVATYPEISARPYQNLCELPELNEALEKLLGRGFRFGFTDEARSTTFYIFVFNPEERPWCTRWHRDWRDTTPGLSLDRWHQKMADVRLFNQVNAPLYNDSCLWVVPGSHARRDLPAEIQRFPMRPLPLPQFDGMSSEEAERAALEYTTSMPGATQIHLNAGDFMIYRDALWHTGNYLPYQRRATIIDSIWTDEFLNWFLCPPMREDGLHEMLNANIDTPEYQAWAAQHI